MNNLPRQQNLFPYSLSTLQGERVLTKDDFTNYQPLGKGSYGTVYQVTHVQSNKVFAVKIIKKQMIKQHRMQNQVKNEIDIMYQLNHPNIVKLYNHWEDQDHLFLLMEYMGGGQLYQRLKEKRYFTEDVAKNYLADLINAVDYLHNREKQIIHRDIKPENLMLDTNNRLKLIDFGWSNFFNQDQRTTIAGTPEYLAPEMIEKKGHDKSLDIWTIGVLTFEFLTGRVLFLNQPPFTPLVQTDQEQAKNQLYQNILNVDQGINFPPGLNEIAKDFITKLCRKNPEERLKVQEIKKHNFIYDRFIENQTPGQQKIPQNNPQNVQQGQKIQVQGNNQELSQMKAQNIGLQEKIQQLEKRQNNYDRLKEEVYEKMKLKQEMEMENKQPVTVTESRQIKALEQKISILNENQEKLYSQIKEQDIKIHRSQNQEQEFQNLQKKYEDQTKQLASVNKENAHLLNLYEKEKQKNDNNKSQKTSILSTAPQNRTITENQIEELQQLVITLTQKLTEYNDQIQKFESIQNENIELKEKIIAFTQKLNYIQETCENKITQQFDHQIQQIKQDYQSKIDNLQKQLKNHESNQIQQENTFAQQDHSEDFERIKRMNADLQRALQEQKQLNISHNNRIKELEISNNENILRLKRKI